MKTGQRKVVVIGAGSVGTTYIYALVKTAIAGEVALIDIDEKRVVGEIMDLSHGLPFIPPVMLKTGDYHDCEDADIIVVTAGAKQSQGQSRTDLIRKNADIVKSICATIKKQHTSAIMIMVTNPVDALTWVALQELGWPRERIIGSGTVLDSARFKFMLSRHCNLDPRNVHAYILGEHGDSEIAPWSLAHIAGVPIKEYCRLCRKCDYEKEHAQIVKQVRDSAYHIIDYKGSTYFAIGLSLVRISEAILRNENSVLTISTLPNGEYGINDVCLSLPCIIGKNGIDKIIEGPLTDAEQQGLQKSAQAIRKSLEAIKE